MGKLQIVLCAALLWAGAATAGDIQGDSWTTTVLTNSASVQASNATTNNNVYTGDLVYLYIDVGGHHSPTVTVNVATESGLGWPSRTLFNKVVTADGGFPVRQLVTSTAGTAATDAYGCLPLFFDKLVYSAYSSGVTNATTVGVYPYIKP